MALDKLIGNDGKFATVALGSPIIAAATLVDGEYYSVIAVDDSTALPTGVSALSVFMADGTETLVGDDSVYHLKQSDSCDITSWSLDNSLAEIDVSTLCDTENKYRAGRGDNTGSIEGIYTVGTTDVVAGMLNRFSIISSQAEAGGAVTETAINNDPMYVMLYLQKDDTAGETVEFYLAPITLLGFNNGITGTDAQSFSSSFRIAPSTLIKKQLVKTLITT
jgi:hypothetical protein